MLLDSMVKVLAPIRLNESVRLLLMESMAVRIPTSAIIPNAMMKTVSIVLSKLVLMDFREILRFSKNMANRMAEFLIFNKNIKF
jgi:hypothetical protein